MIPALVCSARKLATNCRDLNLDPTAQNCQSLAVVLHAIPKAICILLRCPFPLPLRYPFPPLFLPLPFPLPLGLEAAKCCREPEHVLGLQDDHTVVKLTHVGTIFGSGVLRLSSMGHWDGLLL